METFTSTETIVTYACKIYLFQSLIHYSADQGILIKGTEFLIHYSADQGILIKGTEFLTQPKYRLYYLVASFIVFILRSSLNNAIYPLTY